MKETLDMRSVRVGSKLAEKVAHAVIMIHRLICTTDNNSQLSSAAVFKPKYNPNSTCEVCGSRKATLN